MTELTDQAQTVTLTYSKVNSGDSSDAKADDNGKEDSTGDHNGKNNTSDRNNSSPKSEITLLFTDTAKENKATLPITGEANSLWLFFSGLGVLLATGFALIFKRK